MYDDSLFDPPAPLARVTFRNPENADIVFDVLMLLDSGADVTLIPAASINQLDLTANADETYELMGFDGSTSIASVIRPEMLFMKKTFRGRFLIIDQEWGVIGRDILNLVALVLDGPNLTWHEQRRSR
ncbi:MAG: hypothetical protein M5U34_21380 [Chloroflexi bacterium]|nr:hypothetical protein [Chloroflexota bacterium]